MTTTPAANGAAGYPPERRNHDDQRQLLLCFTLPRSGRSGPTGRRRTCARAWSRRPAQLQLDAGKKWPTDSALREAMGKLRTTMAAALPDIHEKRLAAEGYAALAKNVEQEVGNIVANCKLDARADAQLHLVVAELLDGAGKMAGKKKKAKVASRATVPCR